MLRSGHHGTNIIFVLRSDHHGTNIIFVLRSGHRGTNIIFVLRSAHRGANIIFLDPPTVELILGFESPLVEEPEGNQTLICSLTDGKPANFTSVLWYLDDQLIKESNDCGHR